MNFRRKKRKVIDEKVRIKNKKFAIALLVIGIMGIPGTMAQLYLTSQTPVDINNLSVEQIKQGAYVNSSI